MDYIKNYNELLAKDKINSFKNTADTFKTINNQPNKKVLKFSEKLYLQLNAIYSNITQYDIDKIFFDNNLPALENKWAPIDKDIFVKAIKKKVGIPIKTHDIIEESKIVYNTPVETKPADNNYILLSISSNYRDKELNPNPNEYRYLFTKSGPKYSQSKYIDKILIDVTSVEISHIIFPKVEAIANHPYILICIKELGSNLVGEDGFAKIMFGNKNDNFVEFTNNDMDIYKKTYSLPIILDQLNISFRLPNGELLDTNGVDHTITFKIYCNQQ